MKVTVIDSVGMAHETDATLMGLCDEGHDCYVVIVPFLVDFAHPPQIELSEWTDDTHVSIIGMGLNGEAYNPTEPFVPTHNTWPTRKTRFWHRVGRYVTMAAIAFNAVAMVLNVAATHWRWALIEAALLVALCVSATKLDQQRKDYGL